MPYLGKCFCGKITFNLAAEPIFSQYCHCNKCRELMGSSHLAADKNGYAYTLACYSKDLIFIAGKEHLQPVYKQSSILYQCKFCNSQIYGAAQDESKRKTLGINGNNLAIPLPIPAVFKPLRHVYFANRVNHDFDHDDLPKFIDMPTELGGSGIKINNF